MQLHTVVYNVRSLSCICSFFHRFCCFRPVVTLRLSSDCCYNNINVETKSVKIWFNVYDVKIHAVGLQYSSIFTSELISAVVRQLIGGPTISI